jgi:hypothetical protein
MNVVPIDLSAAPGAKLVKNGLVRDPTPDDLDCDLVLVELRGKIAIDVSWYPERDPAGAYHVTVFPFGRWEDAMEEVVTRTPEVAARFVATYARKYQAEPFWKRAMASLVDAVFGESPPPPGI